MSTEATNPPSTIERPRRSLPHALVVLARPHQWSKSVFVLLGPLYGLRDLMAHGKTVSQVLLDGVFAAGAFALASSACYVVNDLLDAEADRSHPRKKFRPIARGEVPTGVAWAYSLALIAASLLMVLLLPATVRWTVAITLVVYIANVFAYSYVLKHRPIADVMSLSLGFVLRMFGGCAAVAIAPSTWLLNTTLFFSMFLAFGKRLGERRTMGELGLDASVARGVQARYTDDLLRMMVVVTAVATLLTYASYVQSKDVQFTRAILGLTSGFNLLWLTTIPATYALLRSIVLLETGKHDDPTEIMMRDTPMLLSVLAFAGITGAVVVL